MQGRYPAVLRASAEALNNELTIVLSALKAAHAETHDRTVVRQIEEARAAAERLSWRAAMMLNCAPHQGLISKTKEPKKQ